MVKIERTLKFDAVILDNDETSLCLKADEVELLRRLIEKTVPNKYVLRFGKKTPIIRGSVSVSLTVDRVTQEK